MKEWQCIILLLIGVVLIILISYWLTSTLSFWWCNGIVIVVNFIVSVYLILQKRKSSN